VQNHTKSVAVFHRWWFVGCGCVLVVAATATQNQVCNFTKCKLPTEFLFYKPWFLNPEPIVKFGEALVVWGSPGLQPWTLFAVPF